MVVVVVEGEQCSVRGREGGREGELFWKMTGREKEAAE